MIEIHLDGQIEDDKLRQNRKKLNRNNSVAIVMFYTVGSPAQPSDQNRNRKYK